MKKVLLFVIMISWNIELFSQSVITITSQNGSTKIANDLKTAIELGMNERAVANIIRKLKISFIIQI